jgi:hypothetical protein
MFFFIIIADVARVANFRYGPYPLKVCCNFFSIRITACLKGDLKIRPTETWRAGALANKNNNGITRVRQLVYLQLSSRLLKGDY